LPEGVAAAAAVVDAAGLTPAAEAGREDVFDKGLAAAAAAAVAGLLAGDPAMVMDRSWVPAHPCWHCFLILWCVYA
jgi:hypothetical protein